MKAAITPSNTRWLIGNRTARIVVAMSVLAASAGVTTAASGQTTTAPGQRTVLRYAIAGDENNFTPYTATGRSLKQQDILNIIYDTLLYSPFQEEPEPWLATSADMSADGRTWTFRLRNDVTWHDGRPLTAEDVKFTWDYFFRTEQGRYSHHVNDRPYMERSSVIDPSTVSFTCREPCPTFDIDPGADLPILPKHIWENVTEPNRFTADLPIGTGPYKLVDRVPNQSYRFEANTSYFKGRPQIDEIVMPIIPESATMFLALRSGEVDAVSRVVPPEAVAELERSGLRIVRMADYGTIQINFNNQRPPFTNPQFRKALSVAADTDRITQTLLGNEGKPGVDSFLDPDSPFANKTLKHEFSPQRSRQMLDQLDFRDRNGDGIRETPDGNALDFEILVSSLEAREVRASELVGTQLRDVGVNIRVTPLDPATVNSRRQPRDAVGKRVPETTTTGDYDMYVTSYSGGHFHFDPDGLLYAFHSPGTTGFGAFITGYSNPQFDQLVDRAATLGVEERKPLLAEAGKVMYDTPPVISLYSPDGTFAYRPQAYNNWVQEIGHGIFHKRSFLPGAEAAADTGGTGVATDDDDGGGTGVVIAIVAGLALLAAVGYFATRGKRRTAEPSSVGPEVD
jgi:peptide/nickel transport system substrate-binding protein